MLRTLLVTGLVAALVACQTLAGLDEPGDAADASLATAPEAGADAGDTPTGDPCAKLPPPPPDVPPGGEQAFDLVFRYFSTRPVPTPEPGLEICPTGGLDLDACRRPDGTFVPPDQCKTAARCGWGPSCGSPKICDEPGAVDDALGVFLELTRNVPGAIPTSFDLSRGIREGRGNVLILVSGYNGQANDPDLYVTFAGSSGLASTTAPFRDAGVPVEPWSEGWDGHSLREWYVQPTVGRTELLGSSRAYVTDHVIVIEADRMPFPYPNIPSDAEGVTMVGLLRRTAEGWGIVRGRFGGKLATSDLLLVATSVASSDKRICRTEDMPRVIEQICKLQDVQVGSSDSSTCNGVSVGGSFIAVPALVGPRRAPDKPAELCDAPLECPP